MLKSTPYQIFCAVVLSCFCLLFAQPSAFAQSQASTGQIVGTVKDAQGAAVPNATIKVMNVATGLTQTLTSNSDGLFRAVLLPVGGYTVKVTAPGFGEFTQSGYKVEVGSTLDANIVLQVSAVNEEVQVTAASVETTAVQSSATVNSTAISELPINGRRFQDFALLTPTADVDPNRNQITLAGQRGINTNIQIDGADYSNPFFGGIRGGERSSFAPTFPQEAVREFQVVASGFNAEFGRSTGGFVNAVTKSGSNQFHASAFFLSRPQDWAHKNAFGQIASPTQNQYGGSFGGHLIKDKLFYFFSGEQQKYKQTRAVQYPLLVGYDTTANAGTKEAYDFYKSLEGPYKQTNDGITALGRLDFNFSEKNQANIRYNYSFNKALNAVTAGTSLDPTTNSALSNNGTEGDRQNSVVGQFNTFFSPTFINEFRGQYSREDRPREPNVLAPLVDQTIGNFGTVNFLPTTEYDTRIQINDNVTMNRGAHSVKVGVDYNRTYANQFFAFRQTGNFSFLNTLSGSSTTAITAFLRNLSVGNAGGTADPANRFDDPNVRYRRNIGNGLVDMTSHELAFFAQDSWKVIPNLTLSYGLRWEAQYMPQPDTSNTALTTAAVNASLPLIGLKGINPGVIPNQTDQWAPRLGIAWDPFKDGKTVIRAGAGMFYARTPLLSLAGPLNNFRTPPGDVTLTIDGFSTASAAGTACASLSSAACPNTIYKMFKLVGVDLNNYTLDKLPILTVDQVQQINGAVATARGQSVNLLNGLGLITVGDQLKNPRSLQVNFGVEREVMAGLTLGMTMDVVNTVHLNRNRDYDVPTPVIRSGDKSLRPFYGLGSTFTLADGSILRTAARPISVLGNGGFLQVRESSARSLYEALVLRAQYRKKWGQLDTYYTLSKTLDDDSTERNASFAEYADTYNLAPEYNYSRQDRRHRFTFNTVLNLPLGFQLSAVGRFVSGAPIDVITNSIIAPTGSGLTNAQFAAATTVLNSTSGDLNRDTGNSDRPFIAPGVPMKRNAYRNYGNKNVDLRLQRDFRIKENIRISPSFELFNAFKFRNLRLAGTGIFNYGNTGINERTGETLAPTNPNFLQLKDSNGNYLLSNLTGSPLAMQWGIRFNF